MEWEPFGDRIWNGDRFRKWCTQALAPKYRRFVAEG